MNIANNAIYPAGYSAQMYRSQAAYSFESFTLTGVGLDITGGTTGNTSGPKNDAVTLSQEVQSMLDRIKSLDVFSCIFPNNDPRQQTKTLSQVEDDFKADFSDFSTVFGKIGTSLGMSGGDNVIMGLNGTGGMQVNGSDVEQTAVFSKAFASETMTARFAVMAARASLVDAGQTVAGFGDAYAENPIAAIEQNIEALKERLLGFRTQGDGSDVNYGFMRGFEVEWSKVTVGVVSQSDASAWS